MESIQVTLKKAKTDIQDEYILSTVIFFPFFSPAVGYIADKQC